MEEYRLNINGKEVTGIPGQTILEVARENDIFIPTLCFDERTKVYGSCGICMCEVEGNPKLCKACATVIAPGQVIRTNTERVIESRKTNLELLMSNHTGDCRPPCVLACPAQTDCQGYVGLIANGEYMEAAELVKNKIPLPSSLGRVCPHPCETECRRGLVDEPISIMSLKRFAGDVDLASDESYMPKCEPDTNKRIAIIGGGPMGLSAAYFLRQKGHNITIYEAMPKAGGMLRYGIPEYRLPKVILDQEIALIEKMGVEIRPNFKIGEDVTLSVLAEDFDAVLIAIGAWVSTGTGCPGEDADGVMGGIDFLRKVVRNEEIKLGDRVAIVGGGNTAMDACRTAVRLGAKEVYNIYRRTKDEMPAEEIEIVEAEEEGVIFKNLTNPIEIIKDENGHVKEVLLQCMELGEPDESGRRRPVPIEGKTETLPLDNVILAIGQAVDASHFECDKTRKGAIAYDPENFMTSIPGVFAGGDCGNDKVSIAVESIADAKKAAGVISDYLSGDEYFYRKPYYVTRDDITERSFEGRERLFRPEIISRSPEERKNNFSEVVPEGFSEEEAENEAMRCLECGCHDYYECKLVDLANQYDVHPDRFAGEKHTIEHEDDHPFIIRDPNKCILCGLCVRVCDEIMGVGALGLIHRGFDTVALPNMEKPLAQSGCICCGQCVTVCPTGALQERTTMAKDVPLPTVKFRTNCSYCSVGCELILERYGDMLVKSNPAKDGIVNRGLCCGKGKWGFDCAILEEKLLDPLVKVNGQFEETGTDEALMLVAKRMQAVKARYGKDAIAVSISDRFTNGEAYAMKRMAEVMGAKVLCMNSRKSGLVDTLGFDASPNTIDELLSTNYILVAGFNRKDTPVIQHKMREAAEAGAKVVLINPSEFPQSIRCVSEEIYADDLGFLKEVAKCIIDSGRGTEIEGYEALAESLKDVVVSEQAAKVAGEYMAARKAMIVYQQNLVSVDTARLIADIALLSGHIGTPRDGILQLKPKNNSQGLVDIGITSGREALEGVKALMVFGEDADIDTEDLEFLAVLDTHMTDLAAKADVILPGTGAASTGGTYTNTERRLMEFGPIIEEDVELSNWEVAAAIAEIYEVPFGWKNTDDIAKELDAKISAYEFAQRGEVIGNVLTPTAPKLMPAEGNVFGDRLTCTDNLMNMIQARLPESVSPTI